MEFRRLSIPATAMLAALALAVAGCGTASPNLAGSGATPPSGGEPSATGAAPSGLPPSPTGQLKYVFPVSGKPLSYAKSHHDYPATDVIAACGLPVLAVTDGVVLETSRVDKYKKATNDGALRGGLFVSILGDDGVRYYGGHLSTVSTGIEAGVRVHAGQQIGTLGKTGNSNNICHLHFGISPPCARTGDWWVRRGVVWPWSYFDAWRAGTDKSPAAAVDAWKAEHGCPSKAP